jgi:hypothetical protein
MGADWLQLFDKKSCDEILGLDDESWPAFLRTHLARFREFSRSRQEIEGVPLYDRMKGLPGCGLTEFLVVGIPDNALELVTRLAVCLSRFRVRTPTSP